MHDRFRSTPAWCGALALAALLVLPLTAMAQTKASQGKIVCWKDKAGKVIGCGDKVPPEYQESATKEMDTRGVTRRTTDSVDDVNKRRLKDQEAARIRAEDDRKMVDQKRQDTALLDTYSNEKEIDMKRDRDLQIIDLQIEQLAVSLKNSTQRYNETRGRVDSVEKSKTTISPQLKEDLSRAESDMRRFQKSIETKRQDKEDLRKRYEEQRKRYVELRANPQAIGRPTSAAVATPTPAPATPAPAAKK